MVLNSAVSPVSAATAFMKSTSKPWSWSWRTKVKGKYPPDMPTRMVSAAAGSAIAARQGRR